MGKKESSTSSSYSSSDIRELLKERRLHGGQRFEDILLEDLLIFFSMGGLVYHSAILPDLKDSWFDATYNPKISTPDAKLDLYY